jgi:hypothetical protein
MGPDLTVRGSSNNNDKAKILGLPLDFAQAGSPLPNSRHDRERLRSE